MLHFHQGTDLPQVALPRTVTCVTAKDVLHGPPPCVDGGPHAGDRPTPPDDDEALPSMLDRVEDL